MKSEWRVSCNPVCGTTMYIAYRLRDINKVDHSGNREYAGEYTEDKNTVQTLANKLNAKEA